LKKIAVLLSGRGSNFKAIYEAICSGYIDNTEIAVVISDKEKAKGLLFAKEKEITSMFINPKDFSNREEFDMCVADTIDSYNVNLVCLAGYMRIVSEQFVKRFQDRLINIHPSLLPSFPGLNAQKQALEYGVKVSGCTVHFVDEKVDHGAIILQTVVPVYFDDTEESLSNRILAEEHKLYPKAIKLFLEGKIKVFGRKVNILEKV
jgi:phosphoribosylglycinamide formyltransferase-1